MLTVQQIADSVTIASREYPLRKVELFGSYANGSNTPQSDVDLLVEFSQPKVSLLTLCALKTRMEELLGSDVDIVHGPLPDGCLLEIDRRIPLYGAQRSDYSAGFHDIAAHKYQTLHMEDVYETVITDFPLLKNHINEIL